MRFLIVCMIIGCGLLSAAEHPRMIIKTSLGDIEVELFPEAAPETVKNFIGLADGTKPFKDPESGEEVTRPYYDGLTFHRVIPGFMLQGGCPLGNGTGGPGFDFKDEINAKGLGLDDEKALEGGQLHPLCSYMQQDFIQKLVIPRMAEKGITQTSPQAEQEAAFNEVVQEIDGISLKAFYEAVGYEYNDELVAKPPVKGALCMANSGPNSNGSQFFLNLTDTEHLAGKHTVFGQVVKGEAVLDAIAQVERGEGDKPKEPVIIHSIRSAP